MDEKLTFDLFGAKKDTKIWPLGAHILHTYKRSHGELKSNFCVNPVETFRKIGEKMTFDTIVTIFGVEEGPKYDRYYTHPKVPLICL